ncbi:polyisoprenoid-binding protein YceI [Pedobacter sp. UYP24]
MKTFNELTGLTAIKRYLAIILLIPILSITSVSGQAAYKLSSKDNLIKIAGKSNVHDWIMIALNPIAEADFGPLVGSDNIPKSLNELSFTVLAKSLKSEHSSMDTRTYKTIKANDFPKITFKLSNAVISAVAKNKFAIKATGILTIAGVSKNITMQVNGDVKADQSIICTGSESIKLTEYNIDPPSFMLGAMKVANELVVSYTLNFKK